MTFRRPGRTTGSGRRPSRLPDALRREAATRRDAVRRWQRAREDGMTAAAAAEAVGVPRATLFRWARQPVPRSRRPHRLRQSRWMPLLDGKILQLRRQHPAEGRARIVVRLRRDGIPVSESTVGRTLGDLMRRRLVTPAR